MKNEYFIYIDGYVQVEKKYFLSLIDLYSDYFGIVKLDDFGDTASENKCFDESIYYYIHDKYNDGLRLLGKVFVYE